MIVNKVSVVLAGIRFEKEFSGGREAVRRSHMPGETVAYLMQATG